MPGPPKQFDREEALQRAMQVFWANGYDGTNYEKLVSGMGVSRSSLYATFGGKEALFRAALESYAQRQLAATGAVFRGRGKPLARLAAGLKVILEMVDQDEGLGCLIVNTTCEFGSSGTVGDLLQRIRLGMEAMLKGVLDEAVAAGELPRTADTASLARLARTFAYGIGVAIRAGQGAAELAAEVDAMVEMLRRYHGKTG